MPRLNITVDYMDGRTKVIGPLHPDEIDTRSMLLKLAEAEIVSIMFTRASPYLENKKPPVDYTKHGGPYEVEDFE